MEKCLSKSTQKANLAVATTACTFVALHCWASAACTLTVLDGAEEIFHASTDAAGILTCEPCQPLACATGLSATNSGGAYYTIFYGQR